MTEGMYLDSDALTEVLEEKLALLTVREAHLEAAVKQLLTQQNDLMAKINELTEVKGNDDASTDEP